MLAGISSEYYIRLERGTATGSPRAWSTGSPTPSSSTTPNAATSSTCSAPPAAIAPRVAPSRPASPTHHPAGTRLDGSDPGVRGHRATRRRRRQRTRPSLVRTHLRRARAIHPNNARFIFLNPAAAEFFVDWDTVANDTVALLRAEAGRDLYDRTLTDLIGDLSTRSDEFRVRWAAHDVRIHTSGVKRLHHPVVGDLDLPFESFPLPGDTARISLTYSAEPGSPTQDSLDLLASWTTTPRDPSRFSATSDD